MPRIAGTTSQAPPPAGSYAQSVRIGDLVCVSGQGSIDPESNQIVGEGIVEQFHRTMRNVEAALGASGASLDDVIRLTIYLTTPEHFAAFNEAYNAFWDVDDPPARTTVSVVLSPGLLIEIDAMAVLGT